MNKTILRMELKKVGVSLSPQEFKSLSLEELEVMLNNRLNEGDVNMNNNVDEMFAPVKEKMVNALLESITRSTKTVTTHTTKESDRVIAELSKKVEELGVKIDNIQLAPATKINGERNPYQNTVYHYNEYAKGLTPIKYEINYKTEKKEAVFGYCECCKANITSANVVAFSKLNMKHVLCRACQTKVKRGQVDVNSLKNLKDNGQEPNPKNINHIGKEQDPKLMMKCSCGMLIHFKSAEQMKARVEWAKKNNMPENTCNQCAIRIRDTRLQEKVLAFNPLGSKIQKDTGKEGVPPVIAEEQTEVF